MSAAAVSRETLSGRKVRPLLFRKYLQVANEQGGKDTTRRVMTASNSIVTPGQFDWLDLETGRARPNQPVAELRAQCTFPSSGRVRVVSVLPQVRRGDLFWVKAGRFGSRKKSQQTLIVQRVRLARLQDMTDDDALSEGVMFVPKKLTRSRPRQTFAALWNDINTGLGWDANPWVWIYEYRVEPLNVDLLLSNDRSAPCV